MKINLMCARVVLVDVWACRWADAVAGYACGARCARKCVGVQMCRYR